MQNDMDICASTDAELRIINYNQRRLVVNNNPLLFFRVEVVEVNCITFFLKKLSLVHFLLSWTVSITWFTALSLLITSKGKFYQATRS